MIKLEDSYFLLSIMEIEGAFLNLKRLHWFSSCMHIHTLIDEFKDELGEFLDKMMENYIALNEDIDKDLKGIPLTYLTLLDVLKHIRVNCINLLNSDSFKKETYSGMRSYTEDFIGSINSYIYKYKIIESK